MKSYDITTNIFLDLERMVDDFGQFEDRYSGNIVIQGTGVVISGAWVADTW